MTNRSDSDSQFMTKKRLQVELQRCEYCEEKPCQQACPANCSPFDFIMAARVGNPSDLQRSAAEIMRNNPLGGVCGVVCPDRFCMAACSRKGFDGPINIPQVQATVVEMAKRLGGIPNFRAPVRNGKSVAVIGGGPAGLGAAAALAQMGYAVAIFEGRDRLGGALNLIPDERLDKEVVRTDIEFALSLGAITVKTAYAVDDPKRLLRDGYDAVCVTTGLWKPIELGIENEDLAIKMVDLLGNPAAFHFIDRVAVIGGGATALDCAITAKRQGARHVELFMLEKFAEMPLTAAERHELVQFDLELNSRMRVTKFRKSAGKLAGLETRKVSLPEGMPFKPANVRDAEGIDGVRTDFEAVVMAIKALKAALSRQSSNPRTRTRKKTAPKNRGTPATPTDETT